MDENTRRYYLEMMGVQCWQQIDSRSGHPGLEAEEAAGVHEADRTAALDRLDAGVQQCTGCQLHTTRKQAITGRGSQDARLMFVFLSPDVTDDNSATICSGEANALFTKMLAAIDVDIDDVYITSLLKCLLPSGQAASAEQIHLCSDYLGQQIHLIQPELLVVLGETALRCMLQQDVSLDIVRSELNAETVASMVSGTLQASHMYESVPLFASYSPHELLQQPANKRKAWQDLQQIQKIIHGQDTI